MFEMTLEELRNKKENETKIEVSKNDFENNVTTLTSGKGDIISIAYNSANCQEFHSNDYLVKIWECIGKNYTINEEGYVIIEPSKYWSVYKKMPQGKKMLTAKSLILKINGERVYFLPTKQYFSEKITGVAGPKGVYGIYYENELLYIGSTSTGALTRWDKHLEGFLNPLHSDLQLYKEFSSRFKTQADYEEALKKIKFKLLVDSSKIKEDISIEPSVVVLQLMEYSAIVAAHPTYNKQGIVMPFKIDKEKILTAFGDIPPNYWECFKAFLLSDTAQEFDIANKSTDWYFVSFLENNRSE